MHIPVPTPDRLSAARDAIAAVLPVRVDEPMSRHTTFGIGGPADLYCKVVTGEQLTRVWTLAHAHGLPVFVLGSGSNILVSDAGVRGLVIENGAKAVDGPHPRDDGRAQFIAESGASFAGLSRRLCRAGYSGLEWAVGIPGTLGGAVVYNAGAYHGCLSDVLVGIRVCDPAGGITDIPAADLHLEYRSSDFTRGLVRDRLITHVTFDLRPAAPDDVMALVAQLDTKRVGAQPKGRNAGSIFKNPPGLSAWKLIDDVGLRGHRIGDAEITAKHTNFFANTGKATAAEVKQLIDLAQRRVRDRFGVELHREVLLVGPFDEKS